jgi:hypothetical protein
MEVHVSTPNQEANPAPVELNPKQPRTAAAKPAAKQKAAGSNRKPAPSAGKPAPKAQRASRPQSKQDRVVVLLRRSEGVTVAAVMKATGWQKHSVHGFFAGVVRKKLGLNLVSAETNGKRVYRVVGGKGSGKTGTKSGKRADRNSAPARKRAAV